MGRFPPGDSRRLFCQATEGTVPAICFPSIRVGGRALEAGLFNWFQLGYPATGCLDAVAEVKWSPQLAASPLDILC